MTTISPELGASYEPPAVPCRGCERMLRVALRSWERPETALRWCESCSRSGEADPEPRPRGTKARRMTSAELGVGESVMAPAEVIEERRRKAREREEAAMSQGTPLSEPARRDIERRVSAGEDHDAVARRFGIDAATVRRIAREERAARPEPAAPPAEPAPSGWVESDTTEHPIVELPAPVLAPEPVAAPSPPPAPEAQQPEPTPAPAPAPAVDEPPRFKRRGRPRGPRAVARPAAHVDEAPPTPAESSPPSDGDDEAREELILQVGIRALSLRLRLLRVGRALRDGRVEEAGEMLGVSRG